MYCIEKTLTMQPPCSTGLTPSDYHLFLSPQNRFNGVNSASMDGRNSTCRFFRPETTKVLQRWDYDEDH